MFPLLPSSSWCSHYSPPPPGVPSTPLLLLVFPLLPSSSWCSLYSPPPVIPTTPLLLVFSLLSSSWCSHFFPPPPPGVPTSSLLLLLVFLPFSSSSWCFHYSPPPPGVSTTPLLLWCFHYSPPGVPPTPLLLLVFSPFPLHPSLALYGIHSMIMFKYYIHVIVAVGLQGFQDGIVQLKLQVSYSWWSFINNISQIGVQVPPACYNV